MTWAFLCGISHPSVADESLLENARRLIGQRQAEAAFNLLQPHQEELSGEPNYDYLLGVAALDSQRPEIAVFALERAAAVAPESAYIHADLARAYAALGETDAALLALKQAQRLSRDSHASQAIVRQLDALMAEDHNARGHLSAYLEFALGHSTNVNNATSTREMVMPVFGNFAFTLGDASLEAGSNFHEQRGGVGATYPLGKSTALFGTIAGFFRHHAQHPEYDTANLEGTAGITHLTGRQQFTLGVQSSSFELNGQDYRRALSLNGVWRMAFDDRTLAGVFAQAGELSYVNAEMRDVMRYVGGALVSHTLAMPGRPLVHGSLYAGNEVPKNSGVAFVGHHLEGLRLGGEVRFGERLSAQAGVAHEYRRYGGTDPLFLTGRKDRQTEFNLGLVYQLPHGFSLRPAINYLDNHSNAALYAYDRTEAMFNVRKEF